MRKMLMVVLGCFLISSFAFGEWKVGGKPGTEPDGFRGIKWGTKISDLKGMIYVRTAPILGGVKIYIYKRQGDVLQIGKAKLESIEYQFWKGRFCGVAVYFSGYVNWSGLKDALFEKFGKGHQPDKSRESYFWFGTKTKIMVGYNKKTEAGILSMESMKILKEKMEAYRKYRKKKQKKEQKKDFKRSI